VTIEALWELDQFDARSEGEMPESRTARPLTPAHERMSH
jgi:hypothetical protein